MHGSRLSFAIPLAKKVKVRPFLPGGGEGEGERCILGVSWGGTDPKNSFSRFISRCYIIPLFVLFSSAGLSGHRVP